MRLNRLNGLNGLNGPVALCSMLLVTLMSATSYGQDASCRYSVSPDSLTFFEASGGTAEVRVKASAPTCTFNARTKYPWITVSARQEHGEGKVSVTGDANSSLYRVGSVLIDRGEVTVLQYGPRRGSTGS